MIAFAFYGDPKLVLHNTTYFEGILANVAAISALYDRDWSIRLYHDIAPDNPWMAELCKIACVSDRLDLCNVNQLPLPLLSSAVNMFPMLWTLLLIGLINPDQIPAVQRSLDHMVGIVLEGYFSFQTLPLFSSDKQGSLLFPKIEFSIKADMRGWSFL